MQCIHQADNRERELSYWVQDGALKEHVNALIEQCWRLRWRRRFSIPIYGSTASGYLWADVKGVSLEFSVRFGRGVGDVVVDERASDVN